MLTLGADGVIVDGVHIPAVTAPVVVDPTGAGDAFCAGFLARWMQERTPSPPLARARGRRARGRRRRRAAGLSGYAVDFTDESTLVSVCFASPSTIETFGS